MRGDRWPPRIVAEGWLAARIDWDHSGSGSDLIGSGGGERRGTGERTIPSRRVEFRAARRDAFPAGVYTSSRCIDVSASSWRRRRRPDYSVIKQERSLNCNLCSEV